MLAWAERHLKKLEREMYEFFDRYQPFNIGPDFDCNPPAYIVRVRKRQHPPCPIEWDFMVGDIVHNLRVSLDYLALSLVQKQSPRTKIDQLAFPILTSPPKNYREVEDRKLPGTSPEVRRIIEGLQPHHGRHSPTLEPLGALDALENVHKHRYLLNSEFAISKIGYRVISGPVDGVAWQTSANTFAPVQNEMEIARYTITNAATEVEAFASFHVCFDKNSPIGEVVVIRTLKAIRDHIRHDIFPKLDPFLS